MEMREQTAAVKKELLRAGFDNNNLSVKRGRGTAAFWIEIFMDISRSPECYCGAPDQYGRRETCQHCKDKWSFIDKTVEKIALKASGREDINYDHQNIMVQIGFKEA